MVQGTRHCFKCKRCVDDKEVHCHGCNKCFYPGPQGHKCPVCKEPPTRGVSTSPPPFYDGFFSAYPLSEGPLSMPLDPNELLPDNTMFGMSKLLWKWQVFCQRINPECERYVLSIHVIMENDKYYVLNIQVIMKIDQYRVWISKLLWKLINTMLWLSKLLWKFINTLFCTFKLLLKLIYTKGDLIGQIPIFFIFLKILVQSI